MIAFHLRANASAAHVLTLPTHRAQAATVFFAYKAERQRRGYQLPRQISKIQLRPAQDIIVAERIARPARRIETFRYVDMDRHNDVVEAAVALTGRIRIDRTIDLNASFDAP